jgi:2'-5' RNA ligase/ribosomal protein S18 acetylase RimI-like enzyme
VARVRLGVVLPIPAPLAAEIDGLRRACGDRALERIECHITLVPPVNVAVDRLDEVVGLVRAQAAVASPLELILGPPATFLPDAPVLYLAVGGDVAALVQLRERVFTGPLQRSVDWPFVPHVTLADGAGPDRIAAGLVALADYQVPVTVDRVHLLQELEGRRWVAIADAPLGPPAIIGRGGLPLELSVGEILDPEAAAYFAASWDQHLRVSYGESATRQRPYVVVARREGAVVGVATGTTDDQAWLDRLVVGEGVRGQGIGAHLLARVEQLAAERGAVRAVLIAQAGGAAQAFYAGRGWRVDIRLPGWRLGRDFVRMTRDL